jgi:hypothetical protein
VSETQAIDALAPEECVCYGPDGPGCVCTAAERACRAIARGDYELTEPAREWCLSEIAKVEGYDREDYAGDADRHVARGVLDAWTDYCRDKGLL